MSTPFARPTGTPPPPEVPHGPRAFTPDAARIEDLPPEADAAEAMLAAPAPLRMSMIGRLFWVAAGIVFSLALGLALERLVADLFARYPALGWLGLGAAALLVLALIALLVREALALRRLKVLDDLKADAALAEAEDDPRRAEAVASRLDALYAGRTDLATARREARADLATLLDGTERIGVLERRLMHPLDARARALTAASARRVALVTAVSPRALVDVAFVSYESIRLAGAIARLYGARPGMLGYWRLIGAVLAHLAVTGGLVLTDSVLEQLVGQGLATKLSARLGEGVVNGLMTVRVGIAAMRVVRPLAFSVAPAPSVRDFLPDLVNLGKV